MLMDNKECLREFIDTVESDCIWCEKNITGLSNQYNFTLWPKEPKTHAMRVFFKHSIWGGITVSREHNHFIELWWFAPNKQDLITKEFFVLNKAMLVSPR